ncbi:MAG: MBOAT family protein [Deltaproteobacteria bacterium]|nr:MBOAT family protein [Deltaproteobacteria bacterium]
MLFPTFQFAVFFLAVYALHWVLKRWEWPWKLFLLAVSYAFYGAWNPRFLWLILLVSLLNYASAVLQVRARSETARRLWLWAGVGFSLGGLGFFKYFNFFVDSLGELLFLAGLPAPGITLQILLPVGISFFTFQALSYTVDVYRGDLEPDCSPQGLLDFLVYIAFFPQLVAGPIVRASTFLPQFRAGYIERVERVHPAMALILGGFFKKMVLSTYLQMNLVDEVFANPSNYSSWEVLLAVYGFSVQIYCDFSGYTDIAIGTARLMGFEFPDNFNGPYAAVSIQDFWRRWHITLSTWLRDYLYIPLGGNQGGPWRRGRNVMITMLLGGLWHGASLNFVVWGGVHGLTLMIHGLWRSVVRGIGARGWIPPGALQGWGAALLKGFSILVTFHLVSFLWVPFYHREFGKVLEVFQALAGSTQPMHQLDLWVVLAVAVGIGMNFGGGWVRTRYLEFQQRTHPGWGWGLNAALSFLILQASPETVPPFIYFQF